MSDPVVHAHPFAELDPATLYALAQLRVDVFVVEQDCAYRELDGRDVEASAWHIWTADGNGPTSYLRVLGDPDGSARIGRVCTRADARGGGLAAHLMARALEVAAPRRTVLDAQSRLVGWYERFGFRAEGEEFLEDGIAHRRMVRAGE